MAREVDSSDAEPTRKEYAPAAIVYRSYSNGQDAPVELFIAPESVGADSPSLCAWYMGSVVVQKSVVSPPDKSGLRFNRIVSRGAEHQVDICDYYWRTLDGSVTEQPLGILKQRLAMLLRAGEPSFRVEMCMSAGTAGEAAGASEQLTEFARLVDPEVRRMLQKVVDTGR